MANSNSTILDNDLPKVPTNSARFEELAVALPQHIEQPNLKEMVSKLQAHMLHLEEEYQLAQGCGITQANAILNTLVETEVADAAVLVAITHEATPKVLLTRRASHLKAHAGEVSFAGGKHDAGDNNNIVTALREACEETALPPSKAKIIGQLPPQMSRSGLNVRPIVALVDPDIIYVPELGEIERIFWADLEALKTQPTEAYQVGFIQKGKKTNLDTVCWIIDTETVWGLTGCILASLLDIGFDCNIDWYYHFSDA